MFKRDGNDSRKSILHFNHISKNLSAEEKEMLVKLYEHYHHLSVCYQWQLKKLRRINLAVNMTAIFLTVAGGALSALGGLATLSISAIGLIMHGFKEKYSLTEKVSQCEFAFKNYSKCLNTIRGHLRGIEFNSSSLLADLAVMDTITLESCIPLDKSVKERYRKTYQQYFYSTVDKKNISKNIYNGSDK